MTDRLIGVGPHPLPWPSGPQYDLHLLEEGDTRNVLDMYRYWTVEAITADLDTQRHPVHVAIENWQHDSNIGTIVRSANAFNVAGVHIIGKRHWNRRGAMVTDRYLSVAQYQTVDEFVTAMAGKHIIGIDNIPGAVPLQAVTLPREAVLVFGGEGPGLSAEMQAAVEGMVMIEQYGSTRSINVGVAAGIVLYDWVRTNLLD